jgi:hypothetical protein
MYLLHYEVSDNIKHIFYMHLNVYIPRISNYESFYSFILFSVTPAMSNKRK